MIQRHSLDASDLSKYSMSLWIAILLVWLVKISIGWDVWLMWVSVNNLILCICSRCCTGFQAQTIRNRQISIPIYWSNLCTIVKGVKRRKIKYVIESMHTYYINVCRSSSAVIPFSHLSQTSSQHSQSHKGKFPAAEITVYCRKLQGLGFHWD